MIKLKKENVKYIIIHHTATSRDYTKFKSVKKYHIEENGWEDIGYHWFIEGDGSICKGREEKYVGSHCKYDGMNFESISVALAGNFEKEKLSKGQKKSLDNKLDKLKEKYNVSIKKIIGHRETGASTLCPGDNLISFLQEYRKIARLALIVEKLIEQIKKLTKRVKKSF